MQMYPTDGGYKEQYYAEEYIVEEDVKGSPMPMPMMMKPHDQLKHNHHGYGGHTDQLIKNKYGQQQAHHGYAHGGHNDGGHHGYGGHNGGHHGYGGHDDHHKNGVESYSATYAESRYEKERLNGHGGNSHGYGHGCDAMHNGYGAHDGHKISAMKHDGYGAHQGHYGPPQEIRAPIWKFKGI